MTQDVTYTHKGWLLLCPVFMCFLPNDETHIEARHWLLEPLMLICCFVAMALPSFPLVVTGEL